MTGPYAKSKPTYETHLVDLQDHRIVDMLPDPEAQTLQIWLAAHPEVEVKRGYRQRECNIWRAIFVIYIAEIGFID